MGAVSVDVHRKEREFSLLTLSDEKVVEYLIKHRSTIDMSYGIIGNVNIDQAGDTMEFNIELLALYASLDNILNKVKMKDKDRLFLDLIFEGNTISDISKYHGFPKKTAYRTLERITTKVVKQNYENWKHTLKCRNLI